jgi:hypothetical protein
MQELVFEILLRLAKALLGAIIGILIYLVAVGPLGATGSAELALLAWISGVAFILVVQESPI